MLDVCRIEGLDWVQFFRLYLILLTSTIIQTTVWLLLLRMCSTIVLHEKTLQNWIQIICYRFLLLWTWNNEIVYLLFSFRNHIIGAEVNKLICLMSQIFFKFSFQNWSNFCYFFEMFSFFWISGNLDSAFQEMWEFYWKLIFDVKTSFNLSNSGVPPSVSLPHAESKIEIL